MHIDCFSFTEAGGREENQDAIGVAEIETGGLYIVADGLGGHRLGNLASEIVIKSLLETWNASDNWNTEQLYAAIGQANSDVLKMQKDRFCSAKSTVVALVIQHGKAVWANSGDSRLYYISKSKLAAVTDDHSVAYCKYKAGEITRAQIAWDEDQSSLLRSLGNESRWKPNISEMTEIQPGDAFLLCSDGFWEYVADEEILEDCDKTECAEKWAKKLLNRASARFKTVRDNLSIITIKITA